jgi:hypothetical protein
MEDGLNSRKKYYGEKCDSFIGMQWTRREQELIAFRFGRVELGKTAFVHVT